MTRTPPPAHLPGTAPLLATGDLAAHMVDGIHRFLLRRTRAAPARRRGDRDLAARRQRLARLIGLQGERGAPELRLHQGGAPLARAPGYRIFAASWPVLPGVDGEGLLLEPARRPRAAVVALPDGDWTPETLCGLRPGLPPEALFPCRLAAAGCRVLVPLLLDRDCTHSGLEGVRWTNQPHREFIYRAAFELGAHLIGLEVQMALSAVDALLAADAQPAGLVGYGEGGLVALYAAALDPRLAAAGISGYFAPREGLWQEPIYRNVFGLLEEFGDAELAALVAPRALVVEACPHPRIDGPPPPTPGRGGAAPGRIATPPLKEVRAEFERARKLAGRGSASFALCENPQGPPGSAPFLRAFLRALGIGRLPALGPKPQRLRPLPDPEERRARHFRQLLAHTQELLARSEFRRRQFWSGVRGSDPESWEKSCRPLRQYLHAHVIGRLPAPRMAANPRTRLLYQEAAYSAWELVLDVYPEVFAYGILLLPTDLSPGEKRPLVVCQHGLEGRPQDLADPNTDHPAYHAYACRLAERGFVVYAPQNPYIGGDRFRLLQRLANPLGLSLFSFIVRQHERTLHFLASLPGVDQTRMAFYGLSYGGKTAMRVPALLPQYCLSICSADYNEWIWKNASSRHAYSYLLTGEYEIFEFDLGNTFNYAEMSWLIFPRPFMVERGHHDGVAPDEWVAYEYARTRRHYVLMGLGERTDIEFFDGPHTIRGEGTFRFLEKHLNWPAEKG